MITSPVMRSACRAVISAIVPLEKSDRYFTPRCPHSAFSSSSWNGPLLVSHRLSHIFSREGVNSSSGGRNGCVT